MYHLTTKSFAEHKALQAYYEGIVPLLDAYAEAYMGKYGRLKRFTIPRNTRTRVGARAYFKGLLTRNPLADYIRAGELFTSVLTCTESTGRAP